jgi:ankyrin repeat protein
MKHILITTIAAVVLVRCGGPPKDIWKAAMNGNIEVVKQHLVAGTDVNAKNKYGWTPLHNAAGLNGHGHKEIVELLIANGADVNAKDNVGKTPLDWAITSKQTETADLLRKHGQDG